MSKHSKIYSVIICLVFLTIVNSFAFAQTKIPPTMPREPAIYYSISVVGSVVNPGIYYLLPGSRVSEAVQEANLVRDTLLADVEGILANASTRNIKLQRDGDTIPVDLQKFYTTGNGTHNPYLEDGDVVIVPTIVEQVSIYGAINRPGDYELVESDKLSDIIELAMGLRDDAFLEKAEIVRFRENHIDTEILTVNLKKIIDNPKCDDNLLLKNDDRIFIRSIPEFHERRDVTISGEVKFPGAYSIEEGKTYLSEILEKCGGPTDKADLKNAYLQRRRSVDVIDPEFERLKLMLVEDMTDLEYEYFKTKSRELRGKCAIDFVKLWENKDETQDVLLMDRDYIYIPPQTLTVTVSGQVKNPGLITYIPGENYRYYIEKSGGYGWNADIRKSRLIRATTGEWLKPDEDTIVEVGDMIFVPEKPERDYWELTQEILRAAADMAAVIIVIQNAIR